MALCVAIALFAPLGLLGGQADSGADEKGAIKGVLINGDTGVPIAGQTLYLFKFFSKTDDGKPIEWVMFARDAPSMTTNTSGEFKFGDVPVMTLNSRLNKERQKYTLGLGTDRQTLKNPDGSLLLFEIKRDGVVSLGRLKVKK
jgi:hypothetical protein